MLGSKPQTSIIHFTRFLKKHKKLRGQNLPFEDLTVLDLGSGLGKNSIYFAERGAKVTGIDISDVACHEAKKKSSHLNIDYINDSFGKKLPFENNSFDVVLDVTSSNSLSQREREIYLQEVSRVLKHEGMFFVRALLLDGDKNAKILLKERSGKEYMTYILPEVNLQERVFSMRDFKDMYEKYFETVYIETETHYSRFEDKIYKRRFVVGVFSGK